MTRARVVLALALAFAAGCNDLTQVVLVVESDLEAPEDVDGFDLIFTPGPIAPVPGQFFGSNQLQDFPLSVGFESQSVTASFSIVARLFKFSQAATEHLLVVTRTVSDVRFVDGETRMLVLTLPRACACEGTSCPLPGNPACDNLINPTLQAFDPNVAPPSTNLPVAR